MSAASMIPPYSTEAEQGLLGCVMLDPDKCWPVVQEKLKVGPDVFYEGRHGLIYEAMLHLQSTASVIDMITVATLLKDRSKLEEIGGHGYLSGLQDATPSAMNIGHYIEIVLEKWRLRKLLEEGQAIIDKVREGATSSVITVASMGNLTGAFQRSTEQRGIKDLTRVVIDELNEIHAGRANMGIKCGIRSIDRIVAGFANELVVVAARPSMGKTACLMSIAVQVAKTVGGVGICSLETNQKDLTRRIISSECRLSMRKVREFNDDDFRKLTVATAAVGRMPIQIHHDRSMTIDHVCSTIIGWTRNTDLKAVFIDHLRLIKGTRDHWSEKDRLSEITERLAILKDHLKIPIFLAAQLGRAVEESSKPMLKHLEGSSSIEQDADVVILLHQQNEAKGRSRLPTVDAVAIIEKRRDGETGNAPIVFHRYCGLIEDEPLQPEQQNLLGMQ